MLENLDFNDMMALSKKNLVPLNVEIEVCYTCNLNCKHCCQNTHNAVGMSLEQYDILFDQLNAAGTLFIILTGGEPFTRVDFMEIVKTARKHRLSVSIYTNATLLDDEIIEQIKFLHVHELHISLYSPNSDIHDKITGANGSFNRTISNIQKLTKKGINVRIKCPLMNISVSGKDDMKKIAKEIGSKIQFSPIITAKNNGDTSTYNLRLSEEQIEEIISDPTVIPHSIKPRVYIDEIDDAPCDTVFNGGTVDPYGNVFVCAQLRIKGGNILENSFGEIWKKSKAFQDLRNIKMHHLIGCKECSLFSFCNRCPGLALLEDGDLKGCSTAARTLAKVRKKLNLYATKSIFNKL